MSLAAASFAFAASSDPREDQISAATVGAVMRLEEDIGSERLAPRLTVRQFLQRTGSEPELSKILHRADRIGGPRWLDDQTCQVKLSVSGARVESLLEKTAADQGIASPIPAAAISEKLRDWSGRSFLATGTSLARARVQSIRPIGNKSWEKVDDASCRRAIDEAAADASRKALEAIGKLRLGDGRFVSEILNDPAVGEQVDRWLATRPVTNVRFHDDLSVELTLGVTADEALRMLSPAGAAQSGPNPATGLQLVASSTRGDVRQAGQCLPPATGRGKVVLSDQASSSSAVRMLPLQPPPWSRQAIRAEGKSTSRGSRLKTSRAAEAQAFEKLQQIVAALPLDANTTLSDIQKQNPAVLQTTSLAVAHARISEINYLTTGEATVVLELDGRDLWDQLSRLP
jgi:hypothetical protein